MSAAPLGHVGKVLAFISRHVVADFVERDDPDSFRLDPPVPAAGVVDQLRVLPDPWQRFAGEVRDGE